MKTSQIDIWGPDPKYSKNHYLYSSMVIFSEEFVLRSLIASQLLKPGGWQGE